MFLISIPGGYGFVSVRLVLVLINTLNVVA